MTNLLQLLKSRLSIALLLFFLTASSAAAISNSQDLYTQTALLHASQPQSGSIFGRMVAVSGDLIAAGMPGVGTGEAYLFQRNTGGKDWTEVQRLTASDAQNLDRFGWSVALDGDTLAIGAVWEDGGEGDPLFNTGTVYIYQFDHAGQTWEQVQILNASDAQPNDNFGGNLALQGDTLVVGAYNADGGVNNELYDSGAVYIFQRDPFSQTWQEAQILQASDAQAYDSFGRMVGISGDWIIVGAPDEDGGEGDPLSQAGAAYVFHYDTQTKFWGEEQILHASDAQSGDFFSWSAAVSGSTILIGAWAENGGEGDPLYSAGAAYIFQPNPDSEEWREVQILRASDAQERDQFGYWVALDGDTLLIDAYPEDGGQGDPIINAGAAYIFQPDESGVAWVESQILRASDPQPWDEFAFSVAIQGSVVVCAAFQEDGGPGDPLPDSGAVYVYQAPPATPSDFTFMPIMTKNQDHLVPK